VPKAQGLQANASFVPTEERHGYVMKKYIIKALILLGFSMTFLYACKPSEDNKDKVTHISSDETGNGMGGETDTDLDKEEDKAGTDTDAEESVSCLEDNYDPGFSIIIEAEEAQFTGNVKVENKKHGYTGSGYLTGIQEDSDIVTFTIKVPGTGAYDLNFRSVGNTGYKENNIYIDGEYIGIAKVDGDEFTDSFLEKIYLETGEHEITMKKSWGWIFLDHLEIIASGPVDRSIYEVSSELVDPKASESAKRLMKFLVDSFGNKVISGQYSNGGLNGKEFKAIYDGTGKYPAMLGLDFIEYTPSRVAFGSKGNDVEHAIEFDKEGGIVTFAWHWNAPEPYLPNRQDQPWWSGFYTRATNIDLMKIMNGEDEEGYNLLIRDIDAIAKELKILEAADVPILWRPLHEASGGWFWWGASGPEPYIELYKLLFDRLSNHHDIHNLIWVWNGQGRDWYPGDEYVDIVGTDLYPGERVYSSQAASFNELLDWLDKSRKIIALTENGCIFDPDLAFRDNAIWSYFGTWSGEFVILNNTYTLSEKYTETDMLIKAYTSDKVLTLDELPNLKSYGN